ncbi:MAG: GNAT family N-acetyltransferase [Oscillospiraceae bacterium]|nr:GNAT family N-acetyltransferase [Oscillospiraceae bacterium]
MKEIIEIKQAQEKDIPVLENIYIDVVNWFESINMPIWSKERVSWEGLSKEFAIEDFYIAYINNNPAGCMALQDFAPFFWTDLIKKGEALFLRRLAVKRFASGQNFSKYLLEYAVNKCREKNIKFLRLDTDARKEKLNKIYQDFGFICEKREIKKIGEKDYHIAFYVYNI